MASLDLETWFCDHGYHHGDGCPDCASPSWLPSVLGDESAAGARLIVWPGGHSQGIRIIEGADEGAYNHALELIEGDHGVIAREYPRGQYHRIYPSPFDDNEPRRSRA